MTGDLLHLRFRAMRVELLDPENLVPEDAVMGHHGSHGRVAHDPGSNIADPGVANGPRAEIDFGNRGRRAPGAPEPPMNPVENVARWTRRVGQEQFDRAAGGVGRAGTVAQSIHRKQHTAAARMGHGFCPLHSIV